MIGALATWRALEEHAAFRRPALRGAGRVRGGHRRSPGAQLRHDRREPRARRPGVRHAGRRARARRDASPALGRRRAHDRRRGVLPRPVHDGARRARAHRRRSPFPCRRPGRARRTSRSSTLRRASRSPAPRRSSCRTGAAASRSPASPARRSSSTGDVDDAEIFGDRFAPEEYRRQLARTVVARALESASARAKEDSAWTVIGVARPRLDSPREGDGRDALRRRRLRSTACSTPGSSSRPRRTRSSARSTATAALAVPGRRRGAHRRRPPHRHARHRPHRRAARARGGGLRRPAGGDRRRRDRGCRRGRRRARHGRLRAAGARSSTSKRR